MSSQRINKPRLDALTITQGDLVVLSYLFANFAVRTPAIIEETRAWELEMTVQANAMARKMTERLEQALLAGSELSEFLEPEPDDESATMTLDRMNKHAARLRAEGGASCCRTRHVLRVSGHCSVHPANEL